MGSLPSLKHATGLANLGARVAQIVAWISGIFSLVVCIILIVNQIQWITTDPLNDPSLKALRNAVAKNPNDQQLRESVRVLHLMSRRAFFTNQTQMRIAGLMLAGGVVLFLASMKTYMELRLKLPVMTGGIPYEGGIAERAAGRWAVAAGGGLLVLASLLLVLLSPPTLELTMEAITPPSAAVKPPAPDAPAAPAKETPKEDAKAPAPSSSAKAPEDKPVPAVPVPGSGSAAANWPAFRGPGGLGVAPHPNAPLKWDGASGDNIRWKTPIPKSGTSSPVVWGKLVFVTGSDDETRNIYAFDTETGKPAWEAAIKLVSGTLPKVDSTTYAAPTLALDGERVYGIFATGDLVAYSMDGTKVWGRSLGVPKNSYGHASSLLVHGGLLYVQWDHQTGGHLLGVDAKTGKTVWDQPREVTESWASPVLVNTGSRLELLLNAKPDAIAHDPATGKILWKSRIMDGEVTPSAAFANGIAFFTTERAMLGAVKAGGDGALLWKYEDDLPDVTSPVATAKHVFMAASNATISCLDAATGKLVWKKETEEGFYSSPILVGDRIYLMDKKGVTLVFKASDKYEELAKNPLGEKATCTPAIPDGRIYLRTDKNLYCIGKGGP